MNASLPHSRGFGLVVVLALLFVASGGVAETPRRSDLEQTKRALEDALAKREGLAVKARKVAAEEEKLRLRSVALAGAIQEREDDVTTLERRLNDLQQDREEKRARFARRWRQTGGLMAGLQRLALFPREALIALPRQPTEMVRASILLRGTLPEVQSRADVLRGILDTLAAEEQEMSRQRERLIRAKRDLLSKKTSLEKLLVRKHALRDELIAKADRESKRAEELAAKSRSLEDLVIKLDEETIFDMQATPSTGGILVSRPIASARGRLPFPVRGDVVLFYGQKNQPGLTSKGIEISTRPGAQVVAPFDGVVVFAGNFRGYGQLLIIEHDEGYHSLLAGMGRIDAVMGQTVLVGEPVAGMAESGAERPKLYLELRRNSRPINPLPWLASQKDKIRG